MTSILQKPLRMLWRQIPYGLKLKTGLISDRNVFQNLRSLGFVPNLVVDIGAYEGWWSLRANEVFPEARFLLFEAQEQKAPLIRQNLDGHVQYGLFTGVLSSVDDRVVDFFLMETGSSYYEEATDHPRAVISRRTRTVDSVLREQVLDGPIYVKLDTQGSELDILAGAQRLLDHATFVSIETNILQYNTGAPTMLDVMQFMKSKGFVPFDLMEVHRRLSDCVLMQLDVLFIREESDLRARLNCFGHAEEK